MNRRVEELKKEMTLQLTEVILPFWLGLKDDVNGGFIGRIDGCGEPHAEAERGAVLNCRILWTFSAAYRTTGNRDYLQAAAWAAKYIVERFVDPIYGGIYWSVDYLGRPLQDKKQIYAQAFAIYALSEYYLATADKQAIRLALQLYELVERYAHDRSKGGYMEAFTREWEMIDDMRLSDKDLNQSKTMNTHLHILEAYTNLFCAASSQNVDRSIRALLNVFKTKIYQPLTGHLGLFFDDDWQLQSSTISFGHEIESSWLIHRAALVLDDKALTDAITPFVRDLATVAKEGLLPDYSMAYEFKAESKELDKERHWWVQAETVVGYFNIYHYFNEPSALQNALKCWRYITSHLVDGDLGEWYWSIMPDGSPNICDDRAGFWKCPYHNGRMCIELINKI